jgi:hypothetical protein
MMIRTSSPWVVIVAVIALLATGPVAWAAMTAREAIQPAVQLQHYEALCKQLKLEREQRYVTDTIFQSYDESLGALVAQAQDKADQVGAAWLREVVSGKLRASAEQVSQWEAAALNAYAESWPAVDLMFDNLLLDLRGAVSEVSDAKFDAAARQLRRTVMLHPRQPQGAPSSSYVGDGADLTQLLEELASSRGPLPPPLQGQARLDAGLFSSGEVATAIASYEQQLDALLRETFAAERERPLLAARAKAKRDRIDAAAAEKSAVERWHRLYQLNTSAAAQIGALLNAAASASDSAAGETTQRLWRQKVEVAIYPWLFAEDKTDRVAAWIRRDDSVTAEQRSGADEIAGAHVAQRDQLRRAALERLVQARVQSGMMLQPLRSEVRGVDPDRLRAQQDIDAAFHELIALEAGARKNLEALLNDAQRAQLSKSLTGRSR